MMAGPLILLYEISILISRIARKKKSMPEEAVEEEMSGEEEVRSKE
jgi:Sec-independent protein secretion pathway component TatC